MTMQSRTASGKQAMIQSANQAVGASAPSAGWYLTRCDTGSTLSNASPTATITSGATAITLFTGDVSYLLPDGDTPYHIKVFEPGDPSTFEVMRVTDVTGDTITVDRAREGTTAQTWTTSAHLRLRFDTDIHYKVSIPSPTTTTGDTLRTPLIAASNDDLVMVSVEKLNGLTGTTYLYCRDAATGAAIWDTALSQSLLNGGSQFVGCAFDSSVCVLVYSNNAGGEIWMNILDISDGSLIHEIDLFDELEAVLPSSLSAGDYIQCGAPVIVSGSAVSGAVRVDFRDPDVPVRWFVDLSTGAFSSEAYSISGGAWAPSFKGIGPTLSDGTVMRIKFRNNNQLLYSGGYDDLDELPNLVFGGNINIRNQPSNSVSNGDHFYFAADATFGGWAIYKYNKATLASVDTVYYGPISNSAKELPRTAQSFGLVAQGATVDTSFERQFLPYAALIAGTEDYTSQVTTTSLSLNESGETYFLSPNYAKLRNYIDDL